MADPVEQACAVIKQLPSGMNNQDYGGYPMEQMTQIVQEVMHRMENDPAYRAQMEQAAQHPMAKTIERNMQIELANALNPEAVPDHMVYNKKNQGGIPTDTY